MIWIYDLKTLHRKNPIGIDKNPRFSWKIGSDQNLVMQEAYRIVCRLNDAENTEIIWDSGLVHSRQSQNIPYQGRVLKSREIIRWEVTIYAQHQHTSASADFEMGLLYLTDWSAEWIDTGLTSKPEAELRAPYLKKTIYLAKEIRKARLYQTARGIYHCWMNGEITSDARFAPGNTSYYHRLSYQVSDITQLLKKGINIWAVCLGDGWWRGSCGAFGIRNNYGNSLQYLGQIEIEYTDGSTERFISDNNFYFRLGGLLLADMKQGTVFDARLEPGKWQYVEEMNEEWKQADISQDHTLDSTRLVSEESAPVTEHELFYGREFLDHAGNRIIDFGQNLSGYIRMKFRNCKAGQKITIQHTEALKDGIFDRSNIYIEEHSREQMFQEVIYYARGNEIEDFCAWFSPSGFRYARINGYEEQMEPGDFVAVALYTNMEETFEFHCSDPAIDRLFHNTLWSQKGNFMDVPSDCPTRERSPWTGDAQVYCRTAAELMDVYSFFAKWMQDVALEQTKDGQIPSIAPGVTFHSDQNRIDFLEQIRKQPDMGFLAEVLQGIPGENQVVDGSAGWGDAATVIPYQLYLAYGDDTILSDQYDSARKWVDYMIRNAKNKNPLYAEEAFYQNDEDGDYIWDTGFHWGEWSEPNFIERTLPENFIQGLMENGNPVVATAYLKYSSEILSKMARILKKEEDADWYYKYSCKVADCYQKYLITEDGHLRFSDTNRQAPYVRVLEFNLATGEKRRKITENLLWAVQAEGYHLNTGFLSTPFLLNVISKEGYPETAYRLLEQKTPPSWLYAVTEGATTILESWDGSQNFFGSFNHYSFGAVCDFLFRFVSGIQVIEESAGYQHFHLCPVPGGSLEYAVGAFQSPYGKISSGWKKISEVLYEYKCEIPPNSQGTLFWEGKELATVGSGRYQWLLERKN